MPDRSIASALVVVVTAGLLGATPVHAREARAVMLMHQHKCYICHSNNEAKAGPAYVDVAVKYRGNPRAVPLVVGSIRNGVRSGGPWHMPPHPEISAPDARVIARYILSLK